MIPLRLYLQNFMSYGAPQEISFREAPLWALCGENGAGKSTIFDAITYALFDQHRLGKQRADELIHQGEDQLYVEFDFLIGEDEYRIKRSHHLNGKVTRQVIHLQGPNVPEPGKKSPQTVRETDSNDGFNHWVEHAIGLNYSAFTSSVLLLQGQSDALLKAGSNDRHKILTQIIDLDPYIRLSNRAKEKMKEQSFLNKQLDQQLERLPVVDEQQLVDMSQAMAQSRQEKQQYHERQLVLSEQKVVAENWRKLVAEQQNFQSKLQDLQQLLEHEESITEQAARYRELNTVLPPLRVISQQQQRSIDEQEHLDELSTRQSALQLCMQDAEDAIQRMQQKLISDRARQQELMQCYSELINRKMEFAPKVEAIRTLQKHQRHRAQIDQRIASYPCNLDEQLANISQELATLSLIEKALTPLYQFYTARKNWYQLGEALSLVTGQISTLAGQIRTLQQQELQHTMLLEEWQHKENAAQQSVARNEALLEGPRLRLHNLDEVDGSTQCRYCGQILTPEHLHAERQRLMEELQQLEAQGRDFQQTYEYASNEMKRVGTKLKELQRSRGELQQEYNKVEQKKVELTTRSQGTEIKAREALSQLTLEYRTKIFPQFSDDNSVPISNLFVQSSYPTEQDIHALRASLDQERELRERVLSLETATNERNSLAAQLSYIDIQVRELEQIYAPEMVQGIPIEYEQIEKLYNDIQHQLQTLRDSIREQEQEEKQQLRVIQDIAHDNQELSKQIDTARSHIESAKYILNEQVQLLPSSWQTVTVTHEQYVLWEQEKERLAPAELRLQRLHEEYGQRHYYEQRVQQLDAELAAVPPEARRSAQEIEDDLARIINLYQTAEKQEARLNHEFNDLKRLQLQRRGLERECKEHERLSHLYKSLDTLLGQNSLQRYLLQKAEQAIVTYANETLDKISDGTLRLELVKGSAKGTGALNLKAYNNAVNFTEPLAVQLLSGSQQFRVAVSLALGIGKYASGASHRVESVIIDEGFGSLDAKGRQDMIHVLQALKNELACIIVVSHQDEFFDEFENKYRMDLVNGSTQVSII